MIFSEKQLLNDLLENNILDEDTCAQLNRVLGEGRTDITRLEEGINKGLINKDIIIPFIQNRIRLLTLNELLPEPDTLKRISYKYASFYSLFPLKIEDRNLHCALANPFDASLRQEIETVLEMQINPVWAFSEDIKEAQKRYYGLGARLDKGQAHPEIDAVSKRPVFAVEDSAVKLVEEILLDAVAKRSTDIHIEPHENKLRIRYRIDGLLYDQYLTDSFIKKHETIVARLKVLANLNLADKRKPQDGRIKTTISGHELDLRISILPTSYGETVDIRILDKNQIEFGLGELGLSSQDLLRIKSMLSKQNGIILVTGPTGSGKTTTLYSFLRRLNTPDRKIITIEDPIEYQLDGITQLQVHPQINFTFANGLRSMLRHDPDIMMVGEIRDSETAKIAIQVSLTGHLVLSTVHTNDSISTLTRLQDMGVERYLLTATLECIIAQRLVRKICPYCKGECETKPVDIDFPIYEGKGCANCNNTGYFGRIGVFEIFELGHEIKEMINNNQPVARIREKVVSSGMETLFQSGMEKVKSGITTYSEILRILKSIE